MKSKKINKKLVLKKSTITNLDNNDLNSVYGGALPTYVKTVCFTLCVSNCYLCPTNFISKCDCSGA